MYRLGVLPPTVLLLTVTLSAIASTPQAPLPVLTLTPYAIAHGFTLEPFVINTPNVGGLVSGSGPLGFALRTDEQVLVTTSSGEIRRFPNHSDPQDWSTGTPLSSRGQSNAQAIAQIQVANVWKYYLSEDPLGRIVEIDQDGHNVLPLHILSLPGALCLIPYPPWIVNTHTGHLFATSEGSPDIVEIDPVANTITPLIANAGLAIDGLTFSPDGSIIYVAATGELAVKGFDVATHAPVFISPVTTPQSTPDGIAIGNGTLTGYIYANCNEGVVWEFGLPNTLHAGEVNLIAENGSRGDFIASDPDVYCTFLGHPSLLLTQSDSMVRLDPPGGGFFGPPASSTELVSCSTLAGTVNSFNGDGEDEDLLSSSRVVMGSSWTSVVTSVNSHGASGAVVVTVRAAVHNGPTFTSPLGGRHNESLIAGSFFGKYQGTHNGVTGTVVSPPVPISCSLLGLPWAAQATIVGGGFGDLTNAVSGVIGNQ